MSENVMKDIGPEVLKILGSILCTVMGAILLVQSLGNAITTTDVDDQMSFVILVCIGAVIAVLAFLLVIERWTTKELNAITIALAFVVFFIVGIFVSPKSTVTSIQVVDGLGIGGAIIILLAKKPNFGPEANRRIYQSVGGWLAAIIAIIVLATGLFILLIFDISDYAGNGTYPENFVEAFINSDDTAKMFYTNIIQSSYVIIVGALIILFTAVARNKITLKIASAVLTAGIITCLVGFSLFQDAYVNLNYWFGNENYPYSNVYELQLQLTDPGLFTFGVVMVLSAFISLFLLIYASFASKPLEKWRLKRDRFIAAAEVSIREQRLDKAVKYLELASHWSSRVEEEDKAVELLTKVRQIEKKAIAMKKAEAAKDAKKKLAAEKKKEAAAKKKAAAASAPKKKKKKEAPPKKDAKPPAKPGK
ncbi:MAG: hypothetical protein ACTSU5_21340 [Promethearchaeota archaeon]